ncbi:MFS family permease [Symbiobacterium terraclitae]|uniref:MFS family permease n=1 Tax=Symbiobacterium terraclitae TaxID=557451 RepID=A0ABS4JQP6_9FIRM|nr:MFS transporter [Symbiobacterium terraclitae]MBP2017862.1 MFS family permease [Symbiobacterium terraclitae]
MSTDHGVLALMRHRNYMLYWFGFLISNAGAWIQSVAQGWLVYEISDSAAWLGTVGFVRAFPLILLSLIGGTVADRFPKRRILYITQSVQLLSAFILGTLTLLGHIQVWHVVLLSAVSAAAQAFDQPTRHALVPQLVPRSILHSAISFNSIAFNGAALFGPSLTGVLVPLIGFAGCFYVNAASFVAVFIALALMDFPPHRPGERKQSMLQDLREGLAFIRHSPIILALISMAAVTSFFARPYQQFITVFAKDVVHGDVGIAGLMQAAPALGTVIFMLAIVSAPDIQWKGKMLLGSGVLFSLALVAFSWSSNLYLSLALLVIVGGCAMTWQTTLNTLLQTNVDDRMRGRVMSAYTMTALAMMPLGQGPLGVAVDYLGPSLAVTLGALISLAWLVYMGILRVREIRALP